MYLGQIQITPTTGRHAETVPQQFFYSRIVEKNEEDFQEINPVSELERKFGELIRDEKNEISKQLEDFGDPVSTLAQDVLFQNNRPAIRMRRDSRSKIPTAAKYTGNETSNPILLIVIEEKDSRRARARGQSDSHKLCVVS